MISLTAADIARALGGRKAGSGWLCRCVSHDDRNPSLSISEGENVRVLVHCHAGCDAFAVIAELDRRGLWPEQGTNREPLARSLKSTHRRDDGRRAAQVQHIWYESVGPRGTWVEDYLSSRGIKLPTDPEVLLRTFRFCECCPFPDGSVSQALICPFTPVWPRKPDDPFLDPLPAAIHRIRGKGHVNKAMLGAVKGGAIMISPWWQVFETLHVCEGVETALALYNQDADDPEGCRRPIWALGSKEAIKGFPVIHRVHRLVIWADNDANGGSVEAALACGARWTHAGKSVVIRFPDTLGEDFADWSSRDR